MRLMLEGLLETEVSGNHTLGGGRLVVGRREGRKDGSGGAAGVTGAAKEENTPQHLTPERCSSSYLEQHDLHLAYV